MSAARAAFSMWGNVGAVEEVEKAIRVIPEDSGLWSAILQTVSTCYANAGRRDEFPALLLDLEVRLTHPESRAEVLLHLAENEGASGNQDTAAGHYKGVLSLDASPYQTQKARGALREIQTLGAGMEAPDFDATTIAGERFRLSDHRGRVVLLEFWATHCVPCVWEIPRLKRLFADLPAAEFRLVGVARNDEPEVLSRFLREQEMTWPQVRQDFTFEGETWVMDPVLFLYNVWGIPRSFLIGRDGTILAKDLHGDALECRTRQAVAGRAWSGRGP